MSKIEEAIECFINGYSCSQAMFSTYSDELGLRRKLAFKIATAFGGGMGHTGETCGAVTGALMVIGLKYGMADADDKIAKERTYEKVNEFINKFRERNDSIYCTALLGYDLSNPDELKIVKEQKLTKVRCPKFIREAAEILEDLL